MPWLGLVAPSLSLRSICGAYEEGQGLKTTQRVNHCSTSWREAWPAAMAINRSTI
jgi:hypothetical protein